MNVAASELFAAHDCLVLRSDRPKRSTFGLDKQILVRIDHINVLADRCRPRDIEHDLD